MSGFLNKKNRIIDYKLTEGGIEKLSRNKFKFKYYTFSDNSIFYAEDFDNKSDNKISNSEESFLPFQTDSNVSFDLNPEINLDNLINFEDRNLKFLTKTELTNKTLSDKIIEKKYIDDITVKNPNFLEDSINFEYKIEESEFDFGDNNFVRRYPTIKYVEEDIKNLNLIQDDKRFLDKLRNLNLPPESTSNNLEEEEDFSLPIEFIFKSYENEILYLNEEDNRDSVIKKVLSVINSDRKLFKLDYKLNEDNIKDEDIYLFELHTVLENNNLEKLCFINIGSFIDETSFKQFNVYLIGKIFLTRDIKNFIEKESNNLNYSINNDYSFVNMFTLVVE
tara:strand:+ start:1221 stop:2225 length:1005 start_codon:yes stop_codon:yes gene_type:complete